MPLLKCVGLDDDTVDPFAKTKEKAQDPRAAAVMAAGGTILNIFCLFSSIFVLKQCVQRDRHSLEACPDSASERCQGYLFWHA
jgi:hypothetical protein